MVHIPDPTPSPRRSPQVSPLHIFAPLSSYLATLPNCHGRTLTCKVYVLEHDLAVKSG